MTSWLAVCGHGLCACWCPPVCTRGPLTLSLLPAPSLSSDFSEVVDLFTSCSVPLPPFPPELEKAGVTWLCLKWQRPSSSPKEDDIYYTLEMEEEGSVCLLLFWTNHLEKQETKQK